MKHYILFHTKHYASGSARKEEVENETISLAKIASRPHMF